MQSSRAMETPTHRIAALDESTWPAFAELVECNNGIFGGCWCMGFHPADDDNRCRGDDETGTQVELRAFGDGARSTRVRWRKLRGVVSVR
jgi:hypothetical protein